MVWAVAGIHSHNWWWVRKYGKMSCGCTRNPLTNRFVLYVYECPKEHLFLRLLRPAIDEEDESDESQPECDQVDPGGDQFEGGDTEHDQRRDQ